MFDKMPEHRAFVIYLASWRNYGTGALRSMQRHPHRQNLDPEQHRNRGT